MQKLITAVILLILMKNAIAHNPQVSTISFIQDQESKWSVFITAPLYTCQLALKLNNPTLKFDSLDVFALQKLIVGLIKNNLTINDNRKIHVVNDKIQVGHETTIYFDIADLSNISRIDFKAFSKLKDHFSLLKIVPQKSKVVSYILNSENGYVYADRKEANSEIGFKYKLYVVASAIVLFFYLTFKQKIFKRNSSE